MGSNSQTTNSSQNQTTSPWSPVIPGLTNLIGQISSGGAPLSSAQQGALGNLTSGANAIPNLGPMASGVVNNLATSNNGIPQAAQIGQNYSQYAGMLAPYLNSSYTNPMNTPGFSQALNTTNQDITNQINGQFAAAGRSGSPANTQALARGLSQGEGNLIANEYNTLSGQQLGAMGSLFNAGMQAPTTEAQLSQMPLQNQLAALQAGSAVPGMYTAPGATQLGIANTAATLPYQIPQTQEQMLMPLGFLGGTASGYGTSTTTQPVNPLTTGLGAGLGLLALSGGFGG